MKKILSFLCFLFAAEAANSQEIIATTAQSVGSGGIVSVSPQAAITSLNPAFAAQTRSLDALLSHTILHELPELGISQGKAVFATSILNLGVDVVRSGGKDSHFVELGGTVARELGPIGIGFQYFAIAHTLPYGQRYWSSFSRFGIYAKAGEQWTLSAAFHNVERRGFDYGYGTHAIEPAAFVGARWDARQLCSMLIEVEKRWDHDAEGKIALVVRPIDKLCATVGFSTLGRSISIGASYLIGKINISAAVSYHDKLGVTSAAQITAENILNK